jgi:hypothetical protein
MHRIVLDVLRLAVLAVLFGPTVIHPQETPVTEPQALRATFVPGEEGLPPGWKPVVFSKIEHHTVYRVVEQDGRQAVEAVADRSASGIAWDETFDPSALPVLEWSWKISGVLANGDIRTKEGDDLPARVLVMFPFDPETASFGTRVSFGIYKAFYGEYPPAQALSYVWASKVPQGEMLQSAYTDRLRHFTVESGGGRAGEWVSERRDIVADFKAAFPDVTLPRMARLAIMVDTDNTGDQTTSWFADVRLLPKGE